MSVRGQPDDGRAFAPERRYRRAAACGDLHETDGHPRLVPYAKHVETGTRSQSPSLSAEKAGRDAREPGLGNGHHPHPHGAWVRLSGCRAGLVQPEGTGMAVVDDAGNRTLCRSSEKGDAPSWQARDHEYGSGQPVHINRPHQDTEGRRHPDQHGRQGRVSGQRLR